MDNNEFVISVDDKYWVIVDKRGYVPFTLMNLDARVHLVPGLEEVIPFVAGQTGCEVKLEDNLDEPIGAKKIIVYRKGAMAPPIEYGFCQPATQFLQKAVNDSMKPSFSMRVIDEFEGDTINEIPIKNC